MIWPNIADLESRLAIEDREFAAWRDNMPDKCWARMDLSALRVGYELGRAVAAMQPNVERASERLDACEWPAGAFTVHDSPGAHDPCFVVAPGGTMIAFNHHATDGVDQARAKLVADACNAYIASVPDAWRTALREYIATSGDSGAAWVERRAAELAAAPSPPQDDAGPNDTVVVWRDEQGRAR